MPSRPVRVDAVCSPTRNDSSGQFRPITKLLYFTVRIDRLLGHSFAAGIWAYLLISVFSLRAVMPDFRMLLVLRTTTATVLLRC